MNLSHRIAPQQQTRTCVHVVDSRAFTHASLPLELREQILASLAPSDAVSLSQVDRAWRSACLGHFNMQRLFAPLPPGQKLRVPKVGSVSEISHAMWRRVSQTSRIQRSYMQGRAHHTTMESENFPTYLRTPEVHLPGQRAAFCANSRYVILRRAGEMRYIFRADIQAPRAVSLFEAQMAHTCASFSADGQRALTCNWQSGAVTLWDLSENPAVARERITSESHERVHSALLSQDGSTIVLRLANQSMEMLWVHNPTKQRVTITPLFGYGLMALSDSGTHLMVYSRKGEAQVWHFGPSAVTTRKITMSQRYCECATLSQDGRFLVATHGDDHVSVCDLTQPERPAQPLGLSMGFTEAIAFSPDSRSVALCNEHDARVFALSDPRYPQTHHFAIQGVAKGIAFSPDGLFLAIADTHSTKIWRLEDATASAAPLASMNTIDGVAFSPDGRYLVQSSADGLLTLWDFLMPSMA